MEEPPKKRVGSAGRPLVSPSVKKAKAKARLKRYREKHPQVKHSLVRLSTAVSSRWVDLANELNMDNNALATLLLDMFEFDAADEAVKSQAAFKLPSTPTPAGFSRAQTSSTDASSPLVSQVFGKHRADDEEMLSSSSGVDDKMVGDLVYKKKEQNEDEDLDNSLEPVISLKKRKSSAALPYATKSKEVHDITEDSTQDDEGNSSSLKPGLHRQLESPKGAEKTRFFIISETRLKDLAMEARPSCIACNQTVEVDVMPSGTSAHVSWKCEQDHISYFCCQETLQDTHLGDLQLASALVLSGNNYANILLMFNFMNLRMIHKKTFNAYQQKFICPVIKEKASDLFQRKNMPTKDLFS